MDIPFFKRCLDLTSLLQDKSYFLFGPRATGKSSLIEQQLAEAYVLDLLDSTLYLRLSKSPTLLEEMILDAMPVKYVVIDEIQRIPELLNLVHRLIEKTDIHFLLTGSSARRLRQKGVNLLAGRAWEARLYPLVTAEVDDFKLPHYLQYGGLPAVYKSKKPQEELFAYIDTYLHEEIQAEALVRNVSAFSDYLRVAALTSGSILNFTQIASDTGLTSVTVKEYYTILEDTFIGFMVKPYQKTIKRKTVSTAKFYLFDIGVCNTLCHLLKLEKHTRSYGQVFEHFIALELRAYLAYRRKRQQLCFWRTKHGQEVDFVIGDHMAIEVKATQEVKTKDLKGLKALMDESELPYYLIVSQDELCRRSDGIHVLHWKEFLKRLWADEYQIPNF